MRWTLYRAALRHTVCRLFGHRYVPIPQRFLDDLRRLTEHLASLAQMARKVGDDAWADRVERHCANVRRAAYWCDWCRDAPLGLTETGTGTGTETETGTETTHG